MEEQSSYMKSIEETKELVKSITKQIEDDKAEVERINARIKQINDRFVVIDEFLLVTIHKKECLDVLLIEIDKGYEKILASSQCLVVLANRKLRMLKRKYSKYI
jgi:hypothetical protein